MVFEDVPGAAYLKLRGLPYSATEVDIAQFFAGAGDVLPDHVLLGVNGAGRASGEAWVQFQAQPLADACRAAKDRAELGSRYVEIFPATFEDCKAAITLKLRSEAPPLSGPPGSGFLRLRGLPFSATAGEVAEVFQEYGVTADQVALGFEGSTGRPSGEAWVVFPSEEMAGAALQTKQKADLGGRYLELFTSSQDEAARAAQRPTQMPWYRGGGWWPKGKGKGGWGGGGPRGGPDLPRRAVTEGHVGGEVVEWRGTFGWIRPDVPPDHPKASQREGKIYVHKKDLQGAEELAPGSKVQFMVYVDTSGLGASEVAMVL